MGSLGGFRYDSIYALAEWCRACPKNSMHAPGEALGIWRSDDGGGTLWRFLLNSEIDYTYSMAVDQNDINVIFSGYNPKAWERLQAKIDAVWTVAIHGTHRSPSTASRAVTSVAIDPQDSTEGICRQPQYNRRPSLEKQRRRCALFRHQRAFFRQRTRLRKQPWRHFKCHSALWGGGAYITRTVVSLDKAGRATHGIRFRGVDPGRRSTRLLSCRPRFPQDLSCQRQGLFTLLVGLL